jgi:hypothetical protein
VSARRVLLFASTATLTLVSCSLFTDLSGFSGGDASPSPDSSLDHNAAADAISSPEASGLDVEAGNGCLPSTTIDLPFTTVGAPFNPFVGVQDNVGGYPNIEAFNGDIGAVLIPVADADASSTLYRNGRSGLWTASPVATVAFDVDFEMQSRCESADDCADGLAFAWFDAPASNAVDAHPTLGGQYGIPTRVRGGAFAADLFLDADPDEATGETAAPALELIAMDETKGDAPYDWIVEEHALSSFNDAWRKVTVSLRNDVVTIGYEGTPAILSGKTNQIATGIVGITAGTGGFRFSAAIRNFHGQFYNCIP